MKTIKQVAAIFLTATTILSCSNESKPTSASDSSNHQKDSLQKPVVNTPSIDSSSNKTMSIEAQFVDFSLGDAPHYSFKDRTGKLWDFAGCNDKTSTFGIELPKKQANEENQGWGSNKTLQGKWFELTYEYVSQPEYQDGPMVKVPVIIKATLK